MSVGWSEYVTAFAVLRSCSADIPMVADLPVGQGLQDHLMCPMVFGVKENNTLGPLLRPTLTRLGAALQYLAFQVLVGFGNAIIHMCNPVHRVVPPVPAHWKRSRSCSPVSTRILRAFSLVVCAAPLSLCSLSSCCSSRRSVRGNDLQFHFGSMCAPQSLRHKMAMDDW